MKREPSGRFSKGQSGNPGGRPARLRELDDAIASANDAPKVLEVIEKLRGMAVGGDVSAARVYLDRTLGPVREPVDDDLSETPTAELAAAVVGLPDVRVAIVDAIMQNQEAREELKRRLMETV